MSIARRGSTDELAGLPARLTDRDYQVIDLLGRHGIMTAAALSAVAFPSMNATNKRLRALAEAGVLARSRVPGTGALRYGLDWAGQTIYALRIGVKPPTRTAAAMAVHRALVSPKRSHDEGVNAAVAALHLACRHSGRAAVTEWLSEAEAAHEFTGLRPDAALTITFDSGRLLRAWYEHDTGTETLNRLTAKITAYRHRRSPLLPHTRTLLIGVATAARAIALTRAVADTGPLVVAAGFHPHLPPASRPIANTARLLTEPTWRRLGVESAECSLVDLAV